MLGHGPIASVLAEADRLAPGDVARKDGLMPVRAREGQRLVESEVPRRSRPPTRALKGDLARAPFRRRCAASCQGELHRVTSAPPRRTSRCPSARACFFAGRRRARRACDRVHSYEARGYLSWPGQHPASFLLTPYAFILGLLGRRLSARSLDETQCDVRAWRDSREMGARRLEGQCETAIVLSGARALTAHFSQGLAHVEP